MSAKPGELKMRWSKRERDMMYDWGAGVGARSDAHLMHNALCGKRWSILDGGKYESSFVDELKARGYDLTTLRFYVRKKTVPATTPVSPADGAPRATSGHAVADASQENSVAVSPPEPESPE